MASEELQDAVIRNMEVIGEAAKRVSPDARAASSRIPELQAALEQFLAGVGADSTPTA